MDNQTPTNASEQPKTTINIQVPSLETIASKRSLIPSSFTLAIIFFFFTFCVIKCNDQKVGTITGINLVTGKVFKYNDLITGVETKNEKMPPSIWAIIAFSAAVIGLGAFLIKEKREALIGTGAGIIGTAALIILQFALKNKTGEQALGQIEIDFQFPYWGALFALGIAAIISNLRMRKTRNINDYQTKTYIENPTATWLCPNCKETNLNTTFKCKQCGYSLV